LFCTGVDVCDGAGSCQHSGNPCPEGWVCNESLDVCQCVADGQCSDGLFCNGVEVCIRGFCVPGEDPCSPLLCDDENDSCLGGACCLFDDTCVDGTLEGECLAIGRTYHEGKTCDELDCTSGACCIDGGCLEALDEKFCYVIGGLFLGVGTTCEGQPCAAGACCMPLGDCFELFEAACMEYGGDFQGPGVDCSMVDCPIPPGACCVAGYCAPQQERDYCLSVPYAEWAGPGTACYPGICPLCDDGDADGDGDVDLHDYASFQVCLGYSAAGDCRCLDTDNRNDVNLIDFAEFQDYLIGPVH